MVFLSLAGVCLARYSGGTGEPNDPYRIGTAADLNDIDNHVEDYNKCFVLVDDINLAVYEGNSVSELVTGEVLQYIKQRGLYLPESV